MNTINLGSGVTMSVPTRPAGDTREFVEVAVWKAGDIWVADTVDGLHNYDAHAKLRIPVAVLEGRAVPEPAKAEPDWRGFVRLPGHGPSSCVRVFWKGAELDLHPDGRWATPAHYFPSRAEAEAALAGAKHPGESA